jgi:hypothetical protein
MSLFDRPITRAKKRVKQEIAFAKSIAREKKKGAKKAKKEHDNLAAPNAKRVVQTLEQSVASLVQQRKALMLLEPDAES